MSLEQLSNDDANSVDGEGVWAPEIEAAFHEGLKLFPPCGRRKHILQEEGGGKMYGRNELIARHILMRTGKMRTRKQVSSHIQVLNRRKQKIDNQSASASTSSDTPSPSSAFAPGLTDNNSTFGHNPFNFQNSNNNPPVVNNAYQQTQFQNSLINATNGGNHLPTINGIHNHQNNLNNHHHNHHHHHPNELPDSQISEFYDFWNDGPIVTQKIRLVEFSAFTEYSNNFLNSQLGIKRHNYVKIDYSQSNGSRQTNKLERIDITQIQDKFPEIGDLYQRSSPCSFFLVKFWADINNDYEYNTEDQNTNFGLSSHFETVVRFDDITVSTKACSYGCQVVEKVDKIYGVFNTLNQRYSYKINNSPMCEFMIKFIKKLRQLPETSQMNSVLENFTVLQVITSNSTSEILMCLAYVFEVASSGQNNGPQYHVYRLSKN